MRNKRGQFVRGVYAGFGFKKNHTPWNKNKKGIHLSPNTEFKKGLIPHNKGVPMSSEAKENLRKLNKGKRFSKNTEFKKNEAPWNKGIKYHQVSGENHPNWKGGISKVKGYPTFIARRRRVRKKANGGSHTLKQWETLKAQYNWTCPCCQRGEPEIKLTEDHIIPLYKGGSDNIENIQPLCFLCNTKKRTKIIKYEYVIN